MGSHTPTAIRGERYEEEEEEEEEEAVEIMGAVAVGIIITTITVV